MEGIGDMKQIGHTTFRRKVLGGWIIYEAFYNTVFLGSDRPSMEDCQYTSCFVPDPEYKWVCEDKQG